MFSTEFKHRGAQRDGLFGVELFESDSETNENRREATDGCQPVCVRESVCVWVGENA